MINKTILAGRLTGDVELTKTNSDLPQARLRLEVLHHPWDAERPPESVVVEVVCYGGRAEVMHRYLHAGREVIIYGRLRAEEGRGLVVVSEGFEFVANDVRGLPMWRPPEAAAPAPQPVPVGAGRPF